MFLHDLALELKMPVGELCNRMSAHELCVEWPAYFSAKNELERRLQQAEGSSTPEQFNAEFEKTTMGGGS